MDSIPAYMVKEFFNYVVERHSIYMRRFVYQDPWPWTHDEILRKHRFTNVFRELDTGTIYCRKYIREPYANHPELFFNICLYRFHNKIETQRFLGHFIKNYDADRIVDKVKQYRDVGNTVFTGAYMITSHFGETEKYSSSDKVEGLFGIALGELWERRRELEPKPGDTLERAYDRLIGSVTNMGEFNVYEIVTDLRWTRYLENASDICDWAHPGPGAKRGIARILRDNSNDIRGLKADDYLHLMRYLTAVYHEHVPVWFPEMEIRDIEHSLCEFDKYMRAKSGGRVRQRFVPPESR